MNKKFERFEKVRQSGITNMLDSEAVCFLADITKEEHHDFITNYDTYIKELNNPMGVLDKKIFMNYLEELKVKQLKGEVLSELELDIYHNGLMNENFTQTSANFILFVDLHNPTAFFDYCLENQIEEFNVTDDVMKSQAEEILANMFINGNYELKGIDFVRNQDEAIMTYTFKLKQGEE